MGNILPWGIHVQYREAIRRNNVKRLEGMDKFESIIQFDKLINDARIKVNKNSVAVLEQEFKRIVSYSLLQLREFLQAGELNAYTVLCAYVYKAFEVNKEINCVTEVITMAFDYATDIDVKYEGKAEKPALYGLPFSVKSNFNMEGYDCTVGVAKLLDQPKDEDCAFVTHLMNLGAIPFVLTNVPQGLLSFVCSNTVYGTTNNPLKKGRVPGGSSGGEAALLAGGGSAFGTGSDLAGSLRIPASMCGLTTIKPTQDRFVVTLTHGGVPGRGRLGLSFGFFTKTVEEQKFLLQLIVGTEGYRQLLPQNPPAVLNFNNIDPTNKLTIGWFDDDEFCPPVPSHRRAVTETIAKLEADGHTIVKFKIPRVLEAAELFYKNVMPDNGAYMISMFANETIDKYMSTFIWLLRAPRVLRWTVSKLIWFFSPQLSLMSGAYIKDINDLRYTQELTDLYRLEFIKYWKKLGIDALICPAFIVPSMEHEYPSKLSTAAFATGFFNMIDFPAGVVPTGLVTSEDDSKLQDETVFPVGRNPVLRVQRNAAANSAGLPNSVQIVTLPFEEEMCLNAMQIVEDVWKNENQN